MLAAAWRVRSNWYGFPGTRLKYVRLVGSIQTSFTAFACQLRISTEP
jgi:hypothetical protein